MRRVYLFPVAVVLLGALAAGQSTSPSQSTQNPNYPPTPASPAPVTPQTAPAQPAQAAPAQNPNSPQTPATQLPQQDQQPALGQRAVATGSGPQVPQGTEIRATLDKKLSSTTSVVGEQFTATVAEPVRAGDGSVAIPAGSKIDGEVTEVEQGKTLPSVRGKGKLNMRFRDVMLPSGAVAPITATLVSVNNTQGSKASTGNEGEVQGGTTGTKVAKNVGIGAGIGTIAGLIFGSAMKGLLIGAIAGGGYVLATGGKDVVLPEQTGLVLRVDQPVMVPSTGGDS